ncbi:putative F-box domain-containing protein [Medicago truncatula]|uniref:F-box protein interaction domain protein n=1 Tax=Medicago truncatula TaxID=3880 RepID=A0A072TJA1_MEDTR|nr:F-box/kelch-repeat protein At3g06240 [Medicago truncatula]KEH16938.1 F-box protein interaction domain protein [Medicago truncatula]RHN45290.1 putative F-box domain-containing protein [Medicago truncatula]
MFVFCFFFFLLFFVKKVLYSKLALSRVQRSKSKIIVTKMEHLPQEVVSNILSRLPSRELLKCKFVCKSWFNFITDPHFISNYYVFYNNLIYSQNQEENLLVIRRPFISGIKTYISLLSWSFNDPKTHVSSSLLNLPDGYDSDHKYWTEIMGPCNGIYFLQGNPNLMMNPSLRQFKALPESHLTDLNLNYSLTDFAGFGLDPKTNDYKVVVLRDIWLKKTDERQKGHWTAELYSLNSNSWRKLENAALPLPIEISGSSSRVYTYVNYCTHWWGYVDKYGNIEDVVLAFNMVDESFRKIKVPKIGYSRSSGECFKTLAPLNETNTIGAIVYPVRGNEKCFDVWVMKDYWDEGSWIKQYSVGPVPMISKFIGFYGSSGFLFKDKNEKLVFYEPEYENIKDLQVCGKHDSIRAVRYMESLVLLQRGKESSQHCFSCRLVPDHILNQNE